MGWTEMPAEVEQELKAALATLEGGLDRDGPEGGTINISDIANIKYSNGYEEAEFDYKMDGQPATGHALYYAGHWALAPSKITPAILGRALIKAITIYLTEQISAEDYELYVEDLAKLYVYRMNWPGESRGDWEETWPNIFWIMPRDMVGGEGISVAWDPQNDKFAAWFGMQGGH